MLQQFAKIYIDINIQSLPYIVLLIIDEESYLLETLDPCLLILMEALIGAFD